MLLDILGFVFSILGITNYFSGGSTLVILAFIYFLVEAGIRLYTGELRSIATYVLAAVIGILTALFSKADMFLTVAVAFCFEELIMTAISVVAITCLAISERRDNRKKKAQVKSVIGGKEKNTVGVSDTMPNITLDKAAEAEESTNTPPSQE